MHHKDTKDTKKDRILFVSFVSLWCIFSYGLFSSGT
jgi:hypothetical protein